MLQVVIRPDQTILRGTAYRSCSYPAVDPAALVPFGSTLIRLNKGSSHFQQNLKRLTGNEYVDK